MTSLQLPAKNKQFLCNETIGRIHFDFWWALELLHQAWWSCSDGEDNFWKMKIAIFLCNFEFYGHTPNLAYSGMQPWKQSLRESGDHDHFPLSAVMCISPELSWFSRRISHFISQWYKQWFLGPFTRIHISTCTLNGGNDQIPGLHPPEAPYMTVLTKNVIGVIRVIVISFQLWALIFLRDHM